MSQQRMRAWGCLAAVLLTSSGVLGGSEASAGSLSGLIEFSTNSGGAASGGQIWNTRGTDAFFDLWVINGNFGGPFVNGPADLAAAINIPLTPGTLTFSLHGEPGIATGFAALNLFFDGNNATPGISVFAPTKTTTGSNPAVAADSAGTLALNGAVVPGAGTLSFSDGTVDVTLTSYQWSIPSVLGVDRVAAFSATPSGVNDFTGQFTLVVTAVPEPASLTLLGLGCLGACVLYRRRSRA